MLLEASKVGGKFFCSDALVHGSVSKMSDAGCIREEMVLFFVGVKSYFDVNQD